jgi:hypothetical protein
VWWLVLGVWRHVVGEACGVVAHHDIMRYCHLNAVAHRIYVRHCYLK